MSTHIPGPKVDHIGVHDRILSGQERGPSRHELLTYLYDLENEHVTAPSSAVLKKKFAGRTLIRTIAETRCLIDVFYIRFVENVRRDERLSTFEGGEGRRKTLSGQEQGESRLLAPFYD